MKRASLSLHSKAPSPFGDRLKLEAEARLDARFLRVRFHLKTDAETFSRLSLPAVGATPSRKNELWKETCFECFILDGDTNSYLEFNGSPTGDWNLYSFDAYRAGMKEVPVSNSPGLQILSRSDHSIELEWSIARDLLPATVGKLSLTTVLKEQSGNVSHWALTHQGEKPDFHLRSSFIYDSIRD